MSWHCSSISEDLHRFAKNLQHMNAKLFLLLFLNNFKSVTPKTITKTILHSDSYKSNGVLGQIATQTILRTKIN